MNLLENKKILVTKTRADAGKSLIDLTEHGAEIIYFPTIRIISKIDSDDVKEKLSKSYEYDYVIFTSGNAAEVFSKAVEKYKLDLAHCKVAAVGSATADKCRELGFYIHIVPQEFSAKGLIKKFSEFDLTNKKILIPCSSLSREDLRLGLIELGADVVSLNIYDVIENNPDKLSNELEKISTCKPDIFIFTSPSSFENFLKLLCVKDIVTFFDRKIICVIGTTTEKAIREHNVVVNIVPEIFSLEGVSSAILRYFQTTSNIA